MPSKSTYGNLVDNGLGHKYRDYTSSYAWNHSPRGPDGKLILKANTVSHTKVRSRTTAWKLTTVKHDRRAIYGNADLYGHPAGKEPFLEKAAINRSYGMLVRQLRGETAALGVTLASWKQSLAMIVLRSTAIRKFAQKCEKKAARQQRASRRQRRKRRAQDLRSASRRQRQKRKAQSLQSALPVDSANLFLEGNFGWLPLVTDIYQAIKVMTDDVPEGWISGIATEQKKINVHSGYYPPNGSLLSFEGTLKFRVKQTCMVQVTNPNVWLANKLGVINPALVAWDLVPWSFVINWFANISQVLGSITDFAGVTISNASTTRKWEVSQGWTARSLPGYDQIMETSSRETVVKHRQLGLMLPSLQMRIPRVDMKLALISVSLMIQQINRLKSS